MTDCPNGDVRDLLPDLLHDRLAPDVRREVEAHVAGCEDCRAELALLGAMRSTLRRAPAVDVATIAAAIPPYRAPMRRSWARWQAAAAVLLLAGGTSIVMVESRTPAPVPVGDSAVAVATSTAGSAVPAAPLPAATTPASVET